MAVSASPDDLAGAVWRKSARSSAQGQNCVEVALHLPGLVAVRDSKRPDGPVLAVSHGQWGRFVAAVKAEACDRVLPTPWGDMLWLLSGTGRSSFCILIVLSVSGLANA